MKSSSLFVSFVCLFLLLVCTLAIAPPPPPSSSASSEGRIDVPNAVHTLENVAHKLSASTVMAGGWRKVDVSDSRIPHVAQFCMQQLNAQSNSVQKYTMNKVLSAEVQVVAGSKWRLSINVQRAGATKAEVHSFTVWEQVWNKQTPLRLLEHVTAQQ